jgi:hypothetical protein
MDVVLTPIRSRKDAWSLKDRLGRELGRVEQKQNFEIMADPASKLHGVRVTHSSLDEAMTAIAARMDGACSLDSQEWD